MNLLKDIKAAYDAPVDDSEDMGAAIRTVTFRLDNETYGINVQDVREVLKIQPHVIRPVPGAPGQVLGVINVRGVIVTVIDARLSFQIPPKKIDTASRVIIVELTEDHVVGFLVDEVREVRDIYEKSISSLSNASDDTAKYLTSVAHVDDNVIIMVDFGKLFNESDLGDAQ